MMTKSDHDSGSKEFDGYHRWLGIPKREQPPNHYRLLGISLFETDPDVIDAAAGARLTYLRQQQSGPHGALCTRILNHVSQARLCLLKEDRKEAYDEQLREELSEPSDDDSPEEEGLASIGLDVSSSGTSRRSAARQSSGPLGTLVGAIIGGLCAWLLLWQLNLVPLWLFQNRKPAPQPRESAVAKPAGKTSTDRKRFPTVTDAEEPSAESSASARKSTANVSAPRNPTARKPDREQSVATTGTRLPVEGQLSTTEDETSAADLDSQSAPATAPAASKRMAEPEGTEVAAATAPEKPVEEIVDIKFQDAIKKLDKAQQETKEKFFKNLKARLAKSKEPMKRQKALSPAMKGELQKMLAACDVSVIPPMRVQGTTHWNGHDYVYIDGQFTWNTARQICEAMGGHLATMNSPAEASFVESTFLRPNKNAAWLGGGDAANEGEWRWVTGEPWQFQAAMNGDRGLAHALTWFERDGFNDWLGDKRQAYLCEWDSSASEALIALGNDTRISQALWDAHLQSRFDQFTQRQERFRAVHNAALRIEKTATPEQLRRWYEKEGFEPLPPLRFQYKKSEYFLFKETKTWHEAEAYCERLGGHLVILNDAPEVELVLSQASQNDIPVWLGCSDELKEGVWRWVSGEPVTGRIVTDNFAGDQHVGWVNVKDTKGPVSDMNASVRSAFVCEWNLE